MRSLLFAIALLLPFLTLPSLTPCYGDYVIAFHMDSCVPCKLMKPVEDKLRAEGFDIREVKADSGEANAQALRRFYQITRVPAYVYVYEAYGKSYDSGTRLLYPVTEGQLRRFCVAPIVTDIGAGARAAVRGILGVPVIFNW